MWFAHYVLLLALANTGAVYDYRGADNRVAYEDTSSSYPYAHQPLPPPKSPSDAEQPNYIERTPQRYNSVQYPRPGGRRGSTRPYRQRSTIGLSRTHQRGSVYIPYRGAVVPVPVITGSNKPYRGVITTTVIDHAGTKVDQNSIGLPARDAPVVEDVCVRCPVDKSVIASRGSSHVLMERSKLKRCRHRPKVPGAKFEILYGPQPGSVLTEGSHTVVGRVIYKRRQLLRCQYNYKVMVRRCVPLMLPSFLEAHCSQGNAWGSHCRLACRQGYQLVGDNDTECGNDLQWTSALPVCNAETSCALPMSPDYGRLSCQAGPGDSSGDQLPEGSVCRYECDEGFAVPANQRHLLVTSCAAGQWNNSVDASCLPLDNTQPLADDPSETQAYQDSFHRTVRLRHRKNRHLATKSADSCTPNPCQSGGSCLAGPRLKPVLCVCPDNREGEFCEREKCSKDICQNGGKCLMYGAELTCYCRLGYSGSRCEIQELG